MINILMFILYIVASIVYGVILLVFSKEFQEVEEGLQQLYQDQYGEELV